jgi:hypothetical protein
MPINNFLLPGIKYITPYTIDNSCRFNLGDSPQLSKSVGSSATTKYTLSLWVKRGNITTSAGQRFLTSTGGGGLGDTYFRFNPSDIIEISGHGSNAAGGGYLITNRKFRDPSAWMHLCVRYDSTESTANDRFRLYINGVDERSVGGYSTDTMPNSDVADNITASGNTLRVGATASAQYCGMYMAEYHFSEGYSYAPTEFGEYDEDSPTIWKPKEASISYGTSGFYLDFKDSANLGNDANGGTDLSETNIAATDQSIDSPTNNFCTFNPLKDGRVNSGTQYKATFSEGNTTSTFAEGTYNTSAFSSIAVSSGKWYAEIKCSSTGGNTKLGLFSADDYGYDDFSGTYLYDSSGTFGGSSYGDSYTDDDIIQIAFDATNGVVWFGKNGTWQDSATQGEIEAGTTTNSAATGIDMTQFWHFGTYGVNGTAFQANFGSPSFAITSGNADGDGYGNFEYAVPSGYYALCTKNLAEYG